MAEETHTALVVSMMPRDTNVHGTIFGGIILSLIDQAGAIHARRVGCRNLVTVAMDRIVFHDPVYVGDVVSLRTSTAHVGNTSVRVKVIVEAERYHDDSKVTVTEGEVVFVNIDNNRQPVRIPRASD